MIQSDAARKTARLRVTGDPAAQPRYFASLHVPGCKPMTGRFDWPGDLNRWVQSARRSAERHGWTVEVHDSTGEVR